MGDWLDYVWSWNAIEVDQLNFLIDHLQVLFKQMFGLWLLRLLWDFYGDPNCCVFFFIVPSCCGLVLILYIIIVVFHEL